MNDSVISSVQQTLDAIEIAEDVVLLAVESGSRAWGFPSHDSDYDVRFIYVRRPEWYFSIDLERRQDVIERPLENEIDLSGWDIRKALKLFHKSNPPLVEWLQSSRLSRTLLACCPASCASVGILFTEGNFFSNRPDAAPAAEKLNGLFRSRLDECWHNQQSS